MHKEQILSGTVAGWVCACGASGFGNLDAHKCKPFSTPKASTNKDGGGLRFNEGKPPIHLVPSGLVLAVASVLGYGAKKYAPRNWERGMKWSVPYDSMMRHLLAWQTGEDTDPESGLPHMHHVACNVAMLVEFMNTYKEGDDRPGSEASIRAEFVEGVTRHMREGNVDDTKAT